MIFDTIYVSKGQVFIHLYIVLQVDYITLFQEGFRVPT